MTFREAVMMARAHASEFEDHRQFGGQSCTEHVQVRVAIDNSYEAVAGEWCYVAAKCRAYVSISVHGDHAIIGMMMMPEAFAPEAAQVVS